MPTPSRIRPTLLLALLLLVLPACGDSQEAAAEGSVELMEQLADILEGIQDEASAEAAVQKIDDWAAAQKKHAELVKAQGSVSSEDVAALDAKFKERTDKAAQRIQTQIQRLVMDPKLQPIFAKAMSKIPQSLGR